MLIERKGLSDPEPVHDGEAQAIHRTGTRGGLNAEDLPSLPAQLAIGVDDGDLIMSRDLIEKGQRNRKRTPPLDQAEGFTNHVR